MPARLGMALSALEFEATEKGTRGRSLSSRNRRDLSQTGIALVPTARAYKQGWRPLSAQGSAPAAKPSGYGLIGHISCLASAYFDVFVCRRRLKMGVYPVSERARQNVLAATSLTFTGLGAVLVFLRVMIKQFMVRSFGWDDVLMILALVFAIGYEVEIMLGLHNRAGYRSEHISLTQMVTLLQLTVAIEITYYLVVYCIKVSILLAYLRFAVTKIFRRLCLGTIIMLTVFVVVCVIVTSAQCLPIEKSWDLTGTVKGTCIDTTAFFYSTSAFNILTDVWIILLPIPTLQSIQRPTREKVALFAVFGMGVFSCIASVARLHTIYMFTLSTDKFFDTVPVNLWSIIEVDVGIICACIPSLKPLLSKSQRQRTRAYRGRSYSYHSQDRPSGKFSSSQGTSKLNDDSYGTGKNSFRLESLPSKIQPGGKGNAPVRITGSGPGNESRENILQISYGESLPPERAYQGPGIYYTRDATVEVTRR